MASMAQRPLNWASFSLLSILPQQLIHPLSSGISISLYSSMMQYWASAAIKGYAIIHAVTQMSKFSLMPRDDKFFDLFEVSASNMVKAAEGLKDMISTWENIDQKMDDLTKIEHQGDTILTKLCSS
jgi:hypothetical protein